TGSSSIFRSIRSSSGPEIRPWYLRRAAGLQLHPSLGPAIFAHGHGFAARTRVNLAGNVVMTPNLATTTSPASSGCRSASSTSLANSGASASEGLSTTEDDLARQQKCLARARCKAALHQP